MRVGRIWRAHVRTGVGLRAHSPSHPPVTATTPGVTTVAALTSAGGYRISPTARYRTRALSKLGIGRHSLPGRALRV